MKAPYQTAALALLLGCYTAAAQTTIFDQNFDGLYTGGFGVGSYGGGSPTGTSATTSANGGNPNGCMVVTMTTTTSGDYYAGQAQIDTVSGNTDANPADYTLSFDLYGSQAAIVQASIQTWPNINFGGTGPVINIGVSDQLTAANTWQTFKVNLGTLTGAVATGGTWQLGFQINASQWGGAGHTDTVKIDNIILTHLGSNIVITSSVNPSAYGAGVKFTAAVATNGVTASNASGQVVFSFVGGPFSTNTMSGGTATSSSITNLPVGSDTITGAYTGGNYPASTNTFVQIVSPPSTTGTAQTNLSIYTDNTVNGFQNSSWATVNLETLNPAPHSGEYCVSVSDAGNQALSIQGPDYNSSLYTSLNFWINGGTGGQSVQVWGTLDNNAQTPYALPTLTSGWQQITIPLATLGVANKSNFDGIWIQGTTGSAQPTFYVDDVQLLAAAPPSVVHLGVNAGQVLETVDARQFGVNTATWDGLIGDSQTIPRLQEMGALNLRWPGGSTSDDYNWTTDPGGNATFQHIATNLGAQVFTTVNYGSGTAGLASSWVLSVNKTNNLGFKYWEVGNECYGSWENDTHAIQHDPFTYATNAAAYILAMKAAYPTVPIRVGIVVVPGESSYVNNMNHHAVNPRTGATNYGWTPIVLSEMKALGVMPDFVIYHYYAQNTQAGWVYYDQSPDSDPYVLQVPENPSPSSFSDWNSAAASLRQQITDYIGAAGNNIELCVTENNSDSGEMGRQSTSLVNALYLADSTSELMKTEFRSYIWWDLHNGPYTDGDFDPTIYGWRQNGDFGMLDGSQNRYPTFYAEKLLQYFARPGDSVLSGGSDSLLLSAYGTRRADGSLTMLVVNKDMTASLNGQIALTNFTPYGSATVQSYGIPQDQAAEFSEALSLQDIASSNLPSAGANFSYSFPPLSLTLFTFPPEALGLSVLGVQPTQVHLQLNGQSGTPYVVQRATSLTSPVWTPVATNIMSGSSTNIFVPAVSGLPEQFYRAVWTP
jgi:alpha-L-arabinofuranosidase